MTNPTNPTLDCALCPRLQEFRHANRSQHGDWFNAPVPSFGDISARLLIVGLAPGLQGANRTGRPFTGDHAGDLLYATLRQFGFAAGDYDKHIDDGLTLIDCMITNAVRCVPPQNKPVGAEIAQCRQFLRSQIDALSELKVILALGRISHDSLLTCLEEKRSHYPFGHAATHQLKNGMILVDSYHCSRYNTNTRRLTVAMFEHAFDVVRTCLDTDQV